jgi:hypothetical protein
MGGFALAGICEPVGLTRRESERPPRMRAERGVRPRPKSNWRGTCARDKGGDSGKAAEAAAKGKKTAKSNSDQREMLPDYRRWAAKAAAEQQPQVWSAK